MLLFAMVARASLGPTLVPDEIVEAVTDDGWALSVRHYEGHGRPVLLVHGMGANHYNFDYREEISLAAHLRARGWDVWVPELRGDPGSRAPSRRALRTYDFDDFARRDLPAIVEGVLARTGEEKLAWVGHSMGGLLLYTALTLYPERVSAGVVVSSPIVFPKEDRSLVQNLTRASGWTVLGPGRLPTRLSWSMTGWLGRHNPAIPTLGNRDNLEWPLARHLGAEALVPVTRATARQAVAWLQHGAFTTREGEPWVTAADVPLLVMGGKADVIAPPAQVEAACDVFPRCTWVLLSKENGFAADYGHIDPLVGKHVRTEVYPRIAEFLDVSG